MANNQKVSFDDINLLRSIITEGKFTSLINNVKQLKTQMLSLNENAKRVEKERHIVAEQKLEQVQPKVEPVVSTEKSRA